MESSTALESGTPLDSDIPRKSLASGTPLQPGSPLECGPPPESGASLESLPRELLLAVLAYVPTEQLLPLRLLGRRWKKLILEEPLWRHRRLDIPVAVDDNALFAAILRMAPALDTLKLRTGYMRSSQGLAYLRALAQGKCKIRFLDLHFAASAVSNKLISTVFSSRRNTLQKLHIVLYGLVLHSNLVPALKAIDALTELNTLRLDVSCGAYHGFSFKNLRLSNLQISCVLDKDLARDLIHLGRNSLKTIKCFSRMDKLKTDFVVCKNLTHLALYEWFDGLDEVVPQLPLLEFITFYVSSSLSESTANWLQWAHRNFAGKIHFAVEHYSADHSSLISSADNLRNVHRVTLNRGDLEQVTPPALVARLLKSLTAVEQLVLNFRTDFESLLLSWPASTVPRLQCLSVRSKYRKKPTAFRNSFMQAVQKWRPNLELKFL
ncbi:uncharacterized protein LOC117647727 [Thrips palmi]|uniref:Uncharacterized protein LOC117647727 n=1 Tax=Thrips palmi TaxID=161013 RepID=A0A6P8Z5W7_THRPL|nr:uncharacterized protein LOC117647727 [Thrips palmi]